MYATARAITIFTRATINPVTANATTITDPVLPEGDQSDLGIFMDLMCGKYVTFDEPTLSLIGLVL
jgi:hypothetical protein